MDMMTCIRKWFLVVLLMGVLGMTGVCHAQKVLIPMDLTQTVVLYSPSAEPCASISMFIRL